MCDPKCGPAARDVAADVADAVMSAVSATCRLGVRLACRPFSDGQLERGRHVLTWPWSIWPALAAGLTAWLGRPAAFVFAGVAAADWLAGRGLTSELGRRRLTAASRSAATRPKAKPKPAGPDLDAEYENLVAAARATGEGR